MPKLPLPPLAQAPVHTCPYCTSQWLRIHNCASGNVLTAPVSNGNSTHKRVPPNVFKWPDDSVDN